MNTITPDHKREFREAREQAIAAVERLNVLFAATGRTYRYELCLEKVQPPVIDDDDDDDDGRSGIGGERSEREDEGDA